MTDPTPPKAFVKWFRSYYAEKEPHDCIVEMVSDWLDGADGSAWRAATAAAYEECATIAEDAHNPPPPAGNDRRWRVAHEIASAIRERAKEEK